MTTRKQISSASPANQDDADADVLPVRVHPVFEIYQGSLPCRIRQDGWWLEDQGSHPNPSPNP